MQPLRHNHQVGETHVQIEKLFKRDPRIVAARSKGSSFLCQGDVCVLPTGEARKRDCASPVVRRPRGA